MGRPKKNPTYHTREERYCIGAICRGEKIFVSYDGARLCKRCKDHNSRIDDPEVSFGNPYGDRPKR